MNRATYLIIGTATALLIVVLTAYGVWAAWVGVLIAGALAVALVVALLAYQPAPPAPVATFAPLPVPPPPPAPPPPPLTIQGVPLPSADADYRFLLYATVCWRFRPDGPDKQHPHPEELAKRIVIERAAQITAAEQPGGYDLVQHRLNNVLATITPDRTGSIEVWAHSVSLTLPNEDMERQYRLSTVRKNEQVWEHERNYERNMRSYLRNEVLGDAGSTVVWWLAKDPRQVQETVGLIGPLAQLSAAANNKEVDPVFRPLTSAGPVVAAPDAAVAPPAPGRSDVAAQSAHTLADTLFPPDAGPQRSRFADQLARLIATSGDADVADRLRTTFDIPDLSTPDPHVPPVPGISETGVPGPDVHQADTNRPAVDEVHQPGVSEPRAPRHHLPEPTPGPLDDHRPGAVNGGGPTGSAHDFEPFWPTPDPR